MRRVLLGFALAFATAATACGGDSATGPSGTIAGTWNLQTVNGAALPFVVGQVGTSKVELTSDVFTLTSTGSFTEIVTLRTTQNGQVTNSSQSDAGTYTVNGTAVTLHFNS